MLTHIWEDWPMKWRVAYGIGGVFGLILIAILLMFLATKDIKGRFNNVVQYIKKIGGRL